MNAEGDLYLGTYSIMDSIDHLIKICPLKYFYWNYWHAPMLHAMVLAIVIAYNMYLDLAEGNIGGLEAILPCGLLDISIFTFNSNVELQFNWWEIHWW